MSNLNKCFLIGNLTRDPELKYIPSGQAVAKFSVAINKTYQGKDGNKKEEVAFITVVAWARLAEICNEYLKKGQPVFVEGRIATRSWEAPDGQKRYATEVVAENIQFLGNKQGSTKKDAPENPVKQSEFGPLAPDEEISF